MTKNETRIATITTIPDSRGWGRVRFADQSFRCYFATKRFRLPNRVPILADRVLVYPGIHNTYHALYLIGTPV